MTATPGDFADLLRDFGVDVTDPDRRLQKARALAAADIDLDDARAVFAHVEATSKPSAAPNVVAGLALHPERLRAAAPDARAYAAARDSRQRQRDQEFDRPFGDAPTPIRSAGEDEAAWIRDRNAIIAVTRIEADGARRDVVAADLRVSDAELDALIERGRCLRGATKPPKAKRDDEGETQGERVQRFKQQMRQGRPIG